MKRVISLFLTVIIVFSFSFNAFAAVSSTMANKNLANAKAVFDASLSIFDINGSGLIDAADARYTLRYSAGLEEQGADVSKMDADGDGMVTAIDARMILRLSAGLDDMNVYLTDTEKLQYFNAILNTAIPNNFTLYKNGIEYTKNITYTDPKGVISSLDSAFKKIDSSMSFATELVAGKGENVYYQNTGNGSWGYAQARMMEILNAEGSDENQSSYLTLDDISSISYKTNQTYTFTRYGISDGQIDKSNVIYSEKVTGLDSITVNIKSDNNVKGAHASKAFIVYSEEDLKKEVEAVANEFNSMSTDLSVMGDMEFKVTPAVGPVKYYDTSITVYYYPDTGKIVAAYYTITTDYTMILNMDVDIYIWLYGVDVDVAGPVNVTNTTQSIKEYYFMRNNPNHVDNW